MNSELTLITKTMDRPKSLRKLLVSMKKYHPDIPIIVTDDSKVPYSKQIASGFNCKAIEMKYDSGLSAGRNRALQEVKTPYFGICDDDHAMPNEKQLPRLLKKVKSAPCDIAGGFYKHRGGGKPINNLERFLPKRKRPGFPIQNRIGTLSLRGKTLTFRGHKEGRLYDGQVDMCSNFFVARTDKVREMGGWDENIKIVREHIDFFWEAKKAGLVVYNVPRVFCFHKSPDHQMKRKVIGYNNMRYNRLRAVEATKIFMDKNNLSILILHHRIIKRKWLR